MEPIIFTEPKLMNNPTEMYVEVSLDLSPHRYNLDNE